MAIVITGATGQLGTLVIDSLLERGAAPADILAGGRNVERLEQLAAKGVRTAVIDYARPETAAAAISAGDTVVLISGNEVGTRVAQHETIIDAAKTAGAARIIYTSVLGGDPDALILAPEHVATESLIRESGLPATVVRNGWYTENYVADIAQGETTGVIANSAGTGRVASASRADYASGIAAVALEDGHEGKVYEFSGDKAWDFDEFAKTLADAIGRDVEYRALTTQEHRAALTSNGVDERAIDFITGLDTNIRDGALGLTTGDLSRVSGRPTTPLAETLRTLTA
ncbi:SDR family oxidoreductase [Pseudoclavibacter terrae]|uniref:SDR family oxidoreductase n=1 Tax=Pseudoclavibacter terrae TaxID=1530195 RepID=A0A7J5B103_9MICO|nr:SDR family oxidoreductase [Pseudoclavibacter terrae]KAB1637587.1 SDR family oxidoreductase [Pseudoclavibacter terrae]